MTEEIIINSLHFPKGTTKEEAKRLTETEKLKSKYKNLSDNLHTLTLAEKKELKGRLVLEDIEDARENFYAYVLLMAPFVIPETFINGRHIKIICDSLQEVEQSVVESYKGVRLKLPVEERALPDRVQYFLPPGGMKSLICSRLFPSWCFGRHNEWRILQFGWGTDFAIDNFGRPLKELLQSPEYLTIFPDLKLKKDAQKSQQFETTAGGTYFCTGAGAGVAGKRATISICDDVLNEQTAYSKTERNKINKWYLKGPRQRLLAWGAEVLVNTRWHIDDLSGSRLKADGELGTDSENKTNRPWKVIRFEAILSQQGADLLGLPVGESFWPELWPKDILLGFKHDPEFSPSEWNSLYMQNPTPDEGNIIKHEQWMRWTARNTYNEIEPPLVDYVIVSADTAFSTSTTADFSAITVWGVFQKLHKDLYGVEKWISCLILLDAERGRWEFPELCTKMNEFHDKYTPDLFIIEKKASGQSLIQELRRQGLPILEYLPDKDKITRLHACTGFFLGGRVWVPEDRNWADEVIDEVCSFPYAPNDDYTDTVSQAILWMRDSWKVETDEYYQDEDEDTVGYKRKTGTYWSNLTQEGS